MTQDMTEGKISPLLLKFTIPLVLGNIFQLTYNAADGIIVGRYVGKEALASVGTANPVMTLAILFINGMCLGAGILISNLYGAKKFEILKKQISTTMISGLIFSLLMSLLFIIFAKPILAIMQVDKEIMDLAAEYMRIIFCGLIFTFIYNFFAGTLRALGDSTSPLYFLIISAILNIAGDFFFVIVLNEGSRGCAVATVISEALCCLMCGIYIKKKVPILDLKKEWFCFDIQLLKKTIQYGWAGAMQQATVQMGKIGIQAIVNTMGVSVMAAFTAVNRIDDFAYTPQQNIGHAMTSLMAQNKGAGKNERVKEGFFTGMKFELIYGIGLAIVCFGLAKPLMGIFVSDEAVILHGVKYLRLISCMYLLPAMTNGIQGYFRGIGDLKVTLLSSFVNMGVRVITACILVFSLKLEIEALPFSYMAGWIGMLLVELPLLFHTGVFSHLTKNYVNRVKK